jgi:uncharacterized protein YhfF
MKSSAADAYWEEFRIATGLQGGRYVAAKSGTARQWRMSCSGLSLQVENAPRRHSLATIVALTGILPQAGDYMVWLDGSGRPRCITRTAHVEVKPLSQVDDLFAWDEGEGDRTRAWWLDAHHRYFQRQADREGFSMHDEIETVFERFELVWAKL